MADIVIRLFSKYSHYKNFYLWEEDDGTLTVHDPNIGKQIGIAFPLPEGHGRCIDADALIRDKSSEATLWCGYEYQDHSVVFEEDIKNAPTIVPAEGGGEDG